MAFGEGIMKVIVKVKDVVSLAQRFQESPGQSMMDLMTHVREGFQELLERVMEAEIGIFLGQPAEAGNKRNGFITRSYALKGIGTIRVRVPRDRDGKFESRVIPSRRRYDEVLEKEIALLHLAGLSTRMLSIMSKQLLGLRVSPQEVSNALHRIVPAARRFLERSLSCRQFKYLYIDGTNFHLRRRTVSLEPTLVVVGVDDTDRKSILAMIQGDKERRAAWEMVFQDLKERGLDAMAVKLGIMDGLPGMADAFREAFPGAVVARCWVHKARNVFPRVSQKYQSQFKVDWETMQYADRRESARRAFAVLKEHWGNICSDAVSNIERDLESLLVHYDFPKEHWNALRTTNPIERVNKEFKRRSRSMETMSPDGLKALLAFTALRLEFGWSTASISSNIVTHLRFREERIERQMAEVSKGLLN